MFLRIFRRCGGRVSYSLPKNNSMLSRICLAVHPSVETEDAAWVSTGSGGYLAVLWIGDRQCIYYRFPLSLVGYGSRIIGNRHDH